jgi:hypothetical protein
MKRYGRGLICHAVRKRQSLFNAAAELYLATATSANPFLPNKSEGRASDPKTSEL